MSYNGTNLPTQRGIKVRRITRDIQTSRFEMELADRTTTCTNQKAAIDTLQRLRQVLTQLIPSHGHSQPKFPKCK